LIVYRWLLYESTFTQVKRVYYGQPGQVLCKRVHVTRAYHIGVFLFALFVSSYAITPSPHFEFLVQTRGDRFYFVYPFQSYLDLVNLIMRYHLSYARTLSRDYKTSLTSLT